MHAEDKDSQAAMTPARALQRLREGNARFRTNRGTERDLLRQVAETRSGQWPFAVVLGCIDSRVAPELIFDQGLGDIFSVRVAGNVANDDVLGSLEFACRFAGAKLVLVLGHLGCGAVQGACGEVQLGHLTALLERITPAIELTRQQGRAGEPSAASDRFVGAVALNNVHLTLAAIRERSPVLSALIADGDVGLAGGMYDVQTGAVEFLDGDALA